MREFCSWRLSRLLDVSAWKRLKYCHLWLLPLFIGLIVGYVYLQHDGDYKRQEELVTMFWFFMLLAAGVLLHTILGADKYCRIKLKTTKCYIYIYRQAGYDSTFQDIIFIQDDTEAHVRTTLTCLREDGYHETSWSASHGFMYCPDGDNNKWYYLSAASDEAQFLGKKLIAGNGTTVFLAGITKDGKQNLCVLHKNGINHIYADSSVVGNAYVPPEAKKNISYVCAPAKMKGDVPDNYLIVENDGKYEVYGLFYLWSDYPQCWKINVPSIIFQEVKDRVVLINEDGMYKLLCRKVPATRWINDVIPELTDEYGRIGGVVWWFDEKTNTIQWLYRGFFRALGFADGSIVGDGWEYAPNRTEGMEYKVKVLS